MVTPLPSLWRLSARSQRMSRANPKWGSSQAIRRPPSGEQAGDVGIMAHTRHGNVDKLAYLRGYSWSATTTSRLPAPIRSETRAMPTDDRIRLDDRQRIASLGKQSIEANKYQPIKNTKGLPSPSRAPQNVD